MNLYSEPNGRRYSQSYMLFYFLLSSERHLRRYICDLPTDITSLSENKRYLSYKFGQLRSSEKLFELMIDEIHVRPKVDIHFDYWSYGLDISDPDNTAKTVFGFMIKSIFGKYQEIISLIPCFRGSYKSLFDLTKDMFNLVEELGGKVISILTDKNRVNAKLFGLFGINDKSVFTTYNDSKLYAKFDPVHLLKNFRNNWNNKKE